MIKAAVIFPKDSEAVFNINSQKSFGGATAQLYNIAAEFQEIEDIEVYSFISNYPKIDFQDISRFRFIKTFNNHDNPLKKFYVYHRKIQQLSPDAILQRGLTFFTILLALYCRFFKIQFLFMFAHDNEVKGRYQKNNRKCPLFRFLLSPFSLLVTQSRYQHDALLSRYGRESVIIKSGYDIEKYSIDEKEFILWVGRLEPWKQPELFLKLAGKFPRQKFCMIAPVINNYPEYGEKIKTLAGEIPNLRLIPFVHFSEINSYFKKAIVFVNTSSAEGFPNTFVQSCKNGSPLLSLNVNPDNFINENDCGFFCEGNEELMIKQLEILISDNKTYRLKSKNAYDYAREYHDIKKNAGKIAELLR